ncbi:hypothetical protein KCU95_g3075, partial [Aureobasidium melanogenum]
MHLLAFGFFPLSLIMRDASHYDHVMQFDVTDRSFDIPRDMRGHFCLMALTAVMTRKDYGELTNRMGLLEARQIFNSDRTVNSLMLCLKREVLSKLNKLVDNWNVYINLCEIDMNLKMTNGDMTIEEASQRRDNNELHADRLRDLYVWARREWAKELRSHAIILTWQRAILNTTAGTT